MSSPHRPDQAASPPEGPGEKTKSLVGQHRSTILWVVAVIAGLLVASLVTYLFARGPDVTTTVARYEVVDASHLRVFVKMTNSGTAKGLVSCLIQASIPQAIDQLGGFENDIEEGQSKTVPVEVTVPDAAEEVIAVRLQRCHVQPDEP